jgi:hypothetical protein
MSLTGVRSFNLLLQGQQPTLLSAALLYCGKRCEVERRRCGGTHIWSKLGILQFLQERLCMYDECTLCVMVLRMHCMHSTAHIRNEI